MGKHNKRRKSMTGYPFIVKVQIEQGPNPGRSMLIYNERRSVFFEAPVDPTIRDALGSDPKGYFHAHMQGNVLHIDGITDDQDW